MKRIYVTIIITVAMLSGCGCGGSQNTEANLQTQAQAPAIEAVDQQGQAFVLAEQYKDGPVVLTFLRSFF